MGLELIDSNSIRKIGKESFSDIDSLVRKDVPILFEQFSSTLGGHSHENKILFYSDGRFVDNYFGIQKGKRNYSYAQVNSKNPEEYFIIRHWNSNLDNHRINVPSRWTSKSHGCMDHNPQESWTEFHSGGTRKIIIGESLEEKYSNALNAIKFAQDSIFFQIPRFYSMQNYLITEIGDTNSNKEENARTKITHRIACVSATWRLLNRVMNKENYSMMGGWKSGDKIPERYSDSLVVNQVGWYRDGTKKLREKGHPVNDEDYLIKELSHPCRNIAFVKAGRGLTYGETYVLPFNKKMKDIVEKAFSNEAVKECFPIGFEERKEY